MVLVARRLGTVRERRAGPLRLAIPAGDQRHVLGAGALSDMLYLFDGPLNISTRPSPQHSMPSMRCLPSLIFPSGGMSQCPWSAVPINAVSDGKVPRQAFPQPTGVFKCSLYPNDR